jgi:hypothetical protein
MRVITLVTVAVAGLVLSEPPPADKELEEFTLVVRTRDDPQVPPDMSVCRNAPFQSSITLGASVWAPGPVPAAPGQAPDDFTIRVGTGTACMHFADPRFPVGSRIPVYAEFVLSQGTYTGLGECTVTSNDKPVQGVLLAGCTAGLVGAPDDVVGGIATTSTVINAGRVPGYQTGSVMTIRGWRTRQGRER